MQGVNVRPIGDNVLVERVTGHGVERTTAGGIVIPATSEAKATTKNDVFRARILAAGPDAKDVQRAVEDGFEHVLVYAWRDTSTDMGKGLYTGVQTGKNRLFIKPDDIVMALTEDADVEASNSKWERK
jgi:co-chaperonin GroES (HSP10)